MPASCSVQRPSRSISRRCLEFILKWNWHLGQTKRFASRSLRKTMVRQESHLTHRPSVRTRRSSGGVLCSMAFLLRLNPVIDSQQWALIVDSPLRQYTLRVRVFHLAHLGDQVSQLGYLWVGVSAGANYMNALWAIFQRLCDFAGVEHFVTDGVIDFVEDHQIVFPAVNCFATCLPALLRQLDIFGIRFGATDLYETAPHGSNFKLVIAQHFGGVQLAVMPGAFDELHHQDAHALAYGAKCRTQRASGLALAGPGINDKQSLFFRHRSPIYLLGYWRNAKKCADCPRKRQELHSG